ncbi:hypothetical protein [Moorena bouillonii]|uniref:Uncharacterized protein n=1 Tax=Moorena bouillonii PNG TaxID=568701 RepID=A0A1U7N5F3_9CYAN|nr:hypothetical protein [Moorena bouillonii]OLT61144.1 hypothetical protein BJP37_21100 [Moorena bouillonii PNG]
MELASSQFQSMAFAGRMPTPLMLIPKFTNAGKIHWSISPTQKRSHRSPSRTGLRGLIGFIGGVGFRGGTGIKPVSIYGLCGQDAHSTDVDPKIHQCRENSLEYFTNTKAIASITQ